MSAIHRCINEHLYYREEILERKRQWELEQERKKKVIEAEKQRLERIRKQE